VPLSKRHTKTKKIMQQTEIKINSYKKKLSFSFENIKGEINKQKTEDNLYCDKKAIKEIIKKANKAGYDVSKILKYFIDDDGKKYMLDVKFFENITIIDNKYFKVVNKNISERNDGLAYNRFDKLEWRYGTLCTRTISSEIIIKEVDNPTEKSLYPRTILKYIDIEKIKISNQTKVKITCETGMKKTETHKRVKALVNFLKS
jgi:hypothetical protein